jgi:hypothetical protein
MLLYKMQNTQFCGTENQHNKYYGAFSREWNADFQAYTHKRSIENTKL